MKKRWLLRLGLLAGLALFGIALVLWWTASGHRINSSGFHDLRLGMSNDEVVAVLGVSPGNYGVSRPLPFTDDGKIVAFATPPPADEHWRGWSSKNGMIIVCFDNDWRVTKKHFLPSSINLLDEIRRLLRRS